jgi:hypothetical protein
MKKLEDALQNRFDPKACNYDICTFEKFIINPTLPAFLATPKQYISIDEFTDFHDIDGEIIQAITEKDPYMSYDVHNFGE